MLELKSLHEVHNSMGDTAVQTDSSTRLVRRSVTIRNSYFWVLNDAIQLGKRTISNVLWNSCFVELSQLKYIRERSFAFEIV